MNKSDYNIMVYCPKCRKRIFDKITTTTGIIRLKCPHCQKLVSINLAFRLSNNPLYHFL